MKKTWLITSIAFWGLAVFCLLNKDEIGFWMGNTRRLLDRVEGE